MQERRLQDCHYAPSGWISARTRGPTCCLRRGCRKNGLLRSEERAGRIARVNPTKKCTFNIKADLVRLLKVEAAVRERDMVELVEEALAWFLHGNLEGLQLTNPLYERVGTANASPQIPPAPAGGGKKE